MSPRDEVIGTKDSPEVRVGALPIQGRRNAVWVVGNGHRIARPAGGGAAVQHGPEQTGLTVQLHE